MRSPERLMATNMAEKPLMKNLLSNSLARFEPVKPANMLSGISSPRLFSLLANTGYPVTTTGFRNILNQHRPVEVLLAGLAVLHISKSISQNSSTDCRDLDD